MVCGKTVKSLMEPPSDKQLELMRRDLNEISDDKLKHNEQLLMEWINCQDHFPKNVDPLFVRGLLRGSKHILEKTKQKLENNLAARHLYPEIYENRSPFSKDVVQAMDVVNIAVMPKLTSKGNRLLICKLNRYDPAEFNFHNSVKLFFMILDIMFASDYMFAGDIIIFDASHFSGNHFTQFFGPFFKAVTSLPKEAYAIRLKEMHFVNAPSALRKMMAIIKMVTHPKARNSIYVHESPKKLLEHVGSPYLPSNFGGDLKSLREIALDWYDVLTDNSRWFESQENVKITVIPKKVQTVLNLKDQLGIEGSFRKLNID